MVKLFAAAPRDGNFYSLLGASGRGLGLYRVEAATEQWKDLYERLEAAIDACRHAGNSVEGLIVKLA